MLPIREHAAPPRGRLPKTRLDLREFLPSGFPGHDEYSWRESRRQRGYGYSLRLDERANASLLFGIAAGSDTVLGG